MTFAIVFGVILYRISIKAALHMSSYPAARSNIRATVKTTAAIINLIVIIILDEIYAAIARWLTTLGKVLSNLHFDVKSDEVFGPDEWKIAFFLHHPLVAHPQRLFPDCPSGK